MNRDLETELGAAVMLGRELPGVLYHYTRQPGVLGILGSKKLWASDVRFLNDELEYEYALHMVESQLSDTSFMSQFDDIPELLGTWSSALSVVSRIRVYVTALSEVADDLSQWRAYCSGGGYAIGFDPGILRDSMARLGDMRAFLMPCEYDQVKQLERIADGLQAMARDYREKKEAEDSGEVRIRYEAMFAGYIMNLAATFKHPCFASEREWRLVARPDPDERSLSELGFREGSRNIVPYWMLPLDSAAVISLWVGPTPHPETAVSAAATLLRSRGFDRAEVNSSDLPFRDW